MASTSLWKNNVHVGVEVWRFDRIFYLNLQLSQLSLTSSPDHTPFQFDERDGGKKNIRYTYLLQSQNCLQLPHWPLESSKS